VSELGCNGIPVSKSSEGQLGGWRKLILWPLVLLVQGVYAGCASIPSREFRQQLGPPVPFQELLEGDAHRDERVVLGGYILETVNEPDGTRLTLLQAPLDSRNKPKSQDLSQGRFVVETQEFLDPAIYTKNRRITVGGKVWGASPQPLGNRTYQYPVIKAEELYLWPKEPLYPRPYYPYYDYWYYPWHRYPYGPYPWYPW
jgi:outer membrane lipoprotein